MNPVVGKNRVSDELGPGAEQARFLARKVENRRSLQPYSVGERMHDLEGNEPAVRGPTGETATCQGSRYLDALMGFKLAH